MGRPRLTVIAGGGAPSRPGMAVVVAVAVLVLGVFGLIRVLQGSPGAASVPADGAAAGPSVGGLTAVSISEGDRVVVAGPGDSLWSIASSHAPDRDLRPVVAAMIDANGGESVQIGQQIVIPRHVLD